MNPTISAQNAPLLHELARLSCGFITRVAWSPGGGTLAVAHGEGVSLWQEGFGGAPTRRLDHGRTPVKDVVFSPDGQGIASAGADTTVRLWMAESGQPVQTLRQHTDSVNAVAFNRNGRLLASGGGDQTLLVFDMSDSSGSSTLVGHSLAGHSGEITSVVFAGETLASGGWDKTVRLWDEKRERAVILFEDWIRDLAASPDGKMLVAACKDGTVRLIDVATAEATRVVQAHDGGADCAAFSPDGALLATGGRDNLVKVWDLASESNTPIGRLEGHGKPVLSVAFHPVGGLLVSGSGDNSVRLWGVDD